MINASGGSTPNPTTENKTNNSPIVTPVAPNTTAPGFPTHNPAIQNKNLTQGVPSSATTTTTTPVAQQPVTPAPVATPVIQAPNSTGAIPPATPKFPDPTKNLVKVASKDAQPVTNGNNKGNGKDTTKPKKKLNLKMVLGVVVLFLVILGSGAGFFLSQQTQDLRQQASGCPNAYVSSSGNCPASCTFNKDECINFSDDGNCSSHSGCTGGAELYGSAKCGGTYTGSRGYCAGESQLKSCGGSCQISTQCQQGLSCFQGSCWGDSCETGSTGSTATSSDKPFNGVVVAEDTGGTRYISPDVAMSCGTNCSDFRFVDNHFDAAGQGTTSITLTKLKDGYTDCSWVAFQRDCNGDIDTVVNPNYATGNSCTATFNNPGNCSWEIGVNFTMLKPAIVEPPTADVSAVCTPNQEWSVDGSLLSYDLSVSNISDLDNFNHSVIFISLGGTKSADTLSLIQFLGATTWGDCSGTTWCGYQIKKTTGPISNGAYSWSWLGSDTTTTINGHTLADISTFVETNLAETYKLPIGFNLTSSSVQNDDIGSYRMNVLPDACADPEKLICDSSCTPPATGEIDQCITDIGAEYSCINNNCRLTNNSDSEECVETIKLSCGDISCTVDTDCEAGLTCITADNEKKYCSKPEYQQSCITYAGTNTLSWTNFEEFPSTDPVLAQNINAGPIIAVNALVYPDTGLFRQQVIRGQDGNYHFFHRDRTGSIASNNIQWTDFIEYSATDPVTTTGTGEIQAFSQFIHPDTNNLVQYLIRNNKFYTRKRSGTANESTLSWTNFEELPSTDPVLAQNINAGPIVAINALIYPDNPVYRQQVIRGSNGNYRFFYRDRTGTLVNGDILWEPNFKEYADTDPVTTIGTGEIQGFAQFVRPDTAYVGQYLIRNNQFFHRERSGNLGDPIANCCTEAYVLPTTIGCNDSCTANIECSSLNSNWSCDDTSNKCRFTTNSTSETCEAPIGAVACNKTCTTNEECELTSTTYSCDTATSNKCRLTDNLTDEECLPEVTTEPTDEPTATPASTTEATPAPGCNDTCITSSDCSSSNHACTTTADGSLKCRLETYPTSLTCTLPASETSQPTLPPELPQTGPEDWLNWFKAGLVTLGLAGALFFLL